MPFFYTLYMMRYTRIVKELQKNHICPFCHEKPENILEEGKYFMVLPSRAPYTKHHLVIIPKRHANLLTELSDGERKEMYSLVDKRAKKLHSKYKDISLLLRDGLVKDKIINKSINHLHFHILPNVGVHIQTLKHQNEDTRIFLDEKTYSKTAQTYKKTFL